MKPPAAGEEFTRKSVHEGRKKGWMMRKKHRSKKAW